MSAVSQDIPIYWTTRASDGIEWFTRRTRFSSEGMPPLLNCRLWLTFILFFLSREERIGINAILLKIILSYCIIINL